MTTRCHVSGPHRCTLGAHQTVAERPTFRQRVSRRLDRFLRLSGGALAADAFPPVFFTTTSSFEPDPYLSSLMAQADAELKESCAFTCGFDRASHDRYPNDFDHDFATF